MPDKTKTVVIIESHEQTIIRRSRRVIGSLVVTQPPERAGQENRKSLGRWWKTVSLKTAKVLAHFRLNLSRRLKTRANEHKNRLS